MDPFQSAWRSRFFAANPGAATAWATFTELYGVPGTTIVTANLLTLTGRKKYSEFYDDEIAAAAKEYDDRAAAYVATDPFPASAANAPQPMASAPAWDGTISQQQTDQLRQVLARVDATPAQSGAVPMSTVTPQPMTDDRRRELLSATPTGAAILAAEDWQATQASARGLDPLSPDRRRQLLALSGLDDAAIARQGLSAPTEATMTPERRRELLKLSGAGNAVLDDEAKNEAEAYQRQQLQARGIDPDSPPIDKRPMAGSAHL